MLGKIKFLIKTKIMNQMIVRGGVDRTLRFSVSIPAASYAQRWADSALQHVKTDLRSMMSEECLTSFVTDILIIKKSFH